MYQKPKPFFFHNEEATQAIVLLHGYAGSTVDMRLLGRFLQRQGYAVYCNNFRGHGTGEPKDILDQGSIDYWLQDARDTVSFVRDHGYKDVAMFGLSLGGIIATRTMEECQDIKCGGAISAPFIFKVSEYFHEQFIGYANYTYNAQARTATEIAENDQYLRANVDYQVNQIATLVRKTNEHATLLNKPFFMAQGLSDKMLPQASAQSFQERLNYSVTYHTYANAGHVLTVNEAHHALENDLLVFLTDNFKK